MFYRLTCRDSNVKGQEVESMAGDRGQRLKVSSWKCREANIWNDFWVTIECIIRSILVLNYQVGITNLWLCLNMFNDNSGHRLARHVQQMNMSNLRISSVNDNYTQ